LINYPIGKRAMISDSDNLQTRTVLTPIVNARGQVICTESHQSYFFVESPGEVGLALTMMAIPGGTFAMGAPSDEPRRLDNEGPVHVVAVPPFFMGETPVTQAQWRFVAGLVPVERDLHPNPSKFKGEDRPVEQVTWAEAGEFCARLSQYTGRDYRLPSEAEWEYACRAGTTTPFCFGETLNRDLANYGSGFHR
jgi:formylglycine-generating enzyme required for sulfatase activity